jgi:leucyl-tRNA synthetase
LLKLLAPLTPHLAEELWHRLGAPGSVHQQAWPAHNTEALQADVVEVVVQINGKVRDKFTVASGLTRAELEAEARHRERIQPYLDGKTIVKVIVVPDKLVNLVIQ